jgi:hypothetical protein
MLALLGKTDHKTSRMNSIRLIILQSSIQKYKISKCKEGSNKIEKEINKSHQLCKTVAFGSKLPLFNM